MSELPSGTVTFLFTDIEGSTRLLRQLGDRYGEVLAEHRRILRGAFAGQGGREIDTQGDAFFVAFGRAREAALAAAAGQRALAAHPWPDGVEPRVRMGLHTGEPTVGEEGYHGFGVHRAARIMAAGHGGQVLCSQATWAVLEDERLPGIAIRELGAYRLKDIDRPERLFQLEIEGLPQEFPPLRAPEQAAPERPLLPAGELPLPGPLVRGSPFPFVGREAELAMLRGLLGRAESGEGGLVLLSAEGGGGKTRLVRELAREAVGRGVVVLYGTSDAAVTTPYQPVREWLEFLLRVCDPEALRECLGGRGGELARVVPELEGLTGRPADTGEVDRHSLQGAVVEFLSRFSRRRPLLVVADDVHWADGETLHLLRRLAGAVPEARVLVLAAHRDRGEEMSPELAGTLAHLSRVDGVSRLALGGLGADEVGAFVRDAADADAAPELVAAIGELTDGSPLLLCELWRDLRESGAVETVNTVRLTRPVAELRGSGRLGEVVQQRLSRLAPETSAFVELAAVAGARFELGVVGEAAGLDRAALVAAVEEATESGIVEELPDPTPACRFSHELVRRTVYDRIKRLRRSELHLRVGEALERAHAADPARVLPELAHHFTQAAPVAGTERAVDYNLRATEPAIAASAYDVAAAGLAAALELGIADPRERTRVQIELAYLLGETGQYAEGVALLDASLDAAASLEEQGLAARALLRLAEQQNWDPAVDPHRTRTIAEQTLATFTELDDPRGMAAAERVVALSCVRVGRVAESCAALERALIHAEASGHRPTLRQVTGSLAYNIGEGPAPVGEAIRRCEELRQANLDDRTLEATVTRILAALLAMAGRRDDALEYARSSSLVLDELDVQSAAWSHRHVAADARALLGDAPGAEQELAAVWAKLGDYHGGAPFATAMHAVYKLALLYCDEGRWDDAERCLAYGSDIPVPAAHRPEAVLALAGRARVAAHRGELAEAASLARRGVELADQSDRPNLRARAWLALAEVQRQRGADREADAAVAAALDLYEQKGNVAGAARLRVPSPGST